MHKSKTIPIESRSGKLINIFFDLFLSPMQQRRGLAEFPNLWEYETIFQCLMETDLIDKRKKAEYDSMIDSADGENISAELFKLKPLAGLKVLEIGGYFSMNLSKLGAIAEKMDAAIDEKEHITLQNHKSKLKNRQFDITLSKEVFDRYSGIENGREFEQACRELLTVFSRVTRKGGISIHEGRMDKALNKDFLDEIGLKLEYEITGKRCTPPFKIYVFKVV